MSSMAPKQISRLTSRHVKTLSGLSPLLRPSGAARQGQSSGGSCLLPTNRLLEAPKAPVFTSPVQKRDFGTRNQRNEGSYGASAGSATFGKRQTLVAVGVGLCLMWSVSSSEPIHADSGRSLDDELPWKPSESFKKLLAKRAESEVNLRHYISSQQQKYLHLLEAMGSVKPNSQRAKELHGALVSLQAEMEVQVHRLIYGPSSTPEQRRVYLDTYGCTKPTKEALAIIASCSKRIIEIGAGRGHWALELETRGIDVLAIDDFSDIPSNDPTSAPVTAVLRGTHELIPLNTDRTLLLVYPPPTSLPLDAVKAYAGKTMIYVGEPVGGANGTEAFFSELEKNWKVKKVVDLEPFEGGGERLWVLERK